MSFHYSHITIAGNLTRDPELRATHRAPVCNFAVAVNRRWRNQAGDTQEETTFVDCESWGRTAELVAQYLHKGSPVLLDGRLRLDSWEDQQGQRASRLKVVAGNVRFLPDARSREGRSTTTDHPAGRDQTLVAEGDPPF